MEIPKDYLERLRNKKRPLKITSERQELIQRFTDKINLERIGTKWRPATWGQVNGLVSFFKKTDLYWLFAQCERASSFSKKFFGVLRDTKPSAKKKTKWKTK